jgi:hypothetical protein
MPCSLLPSSLPFPTIAYPLVCWGGGLNKYQPPAADCLQRPVRRSSSCNIPIADGKDSEDILGSAANLNSKGRGNKSLPTKPRTERRR